MDIFILKYAQIYVKSTVFELGLLLGAGCFKVHQRQPFPLSSSKIG